MKTTNRRFKFIGYYWCFLQVLGKFTCSVIYSFTENEAFCEKVLLPNDAIISHIIHIRYGGGLCGGGKATGIWVLNVLKKLRCKVFITDGHYSEQAGDKAAMSLYPSLRGDQAQMEVLRTLDGEKWSGHGDITWNLIK